MLRRFGRAPGEAGEVLRASDLMIRDVLTVGVDMPLRKAARLLFQREFGCVPVVDENRNIMGILTETDFIRFAAELPGDFSPHKFHSVTEASADDCSA